MVGVVCPCTWGGQAVFLPGDTIPQVPLPAVNQALRSHWPVKLHSGSREPFLVTPQPEPRWCCSGGQTKLSHEAAVPTMSCSSSPDTVIPGLAAAVPQGESLSPREPQWALPAAPLQHIQVRKTLKYEQKGGFSVNDKSWRVTLKRERCINF